MADTLFDIFNNAGTAAPPPASSEPPKMELVVEKKADDEVMPAPVVDIPAVIEEPKAIPVVDASVSVSVTVDPNTAPSTAAVETEPKPKKRTITKKKKVVAASTSAPPKKKKKTQKSQDTKSKKDTKTTSDGRHPPGFSMLKTESDKIDRIIAALTRKKENRIASGKPVPSVCGMFNDHLLKFFKGVRHNFDDEFDEYMSS